jgi:hypothetical protein
VLNEACDEAGYGGGDAAFATSPSADTPQFANALCWWRTITGYRDEDLPLVIVERQTERGLENDDPRSPCCRIAERSTEQPLVEQNFIDGECVGDRFLTPGFKLTLSIGLGAHGGGLRRMSFNDGMMSLMRRSMPSLLARRVNVEHSSA